MKKYFEKLDKVRKDVVVEKFKDHELTRKEGRDTSALERVEELEHTDVLSYYKCTLTEEALSNLILPHHYHGDFSCVKSGGDEFNNVITSICYKIKDQSVSTRCLEKISELKGDIFDTRFCETWDPPFLLLSNDAQTVHPDHYDSSWKDKLFIGNGFHRLVAYGLALKELGKFVPIEVYYGEKN